jgi:hypothetical protein
VAIKLRNGKMEVKANAKRAMRRAQDTITAQFRKVTKSAIAQLVELGAPRNRIEVRKGQRPLEDLIYVGPTPLFRVHLKMFNDSAQVIAEPYDPQLRPETT